MLKKIEELLETVNQFSDAFPETLRSFKSDIEKTGRDLKIKNIYISKKYDVTRSQSVENGVPTTKVENKLSSVSALIITDKLLFEFEMTRDSTRHDCVLLDSVCRVEKLYFKKEGCVLRLSHGLSLPSLQTHMVAYNKKEQEDLEELELFFVQVLSGGRKHG